MKLTTAIAVVFLLAMTLMVSSVSAGVGNDMPSGQHYNLNIIGVPKDLNNGGDDFGGNGARIFVNRNSSTLFYIHGGNTFEVLDHDGTDGKVGDGVADPGITFPYDAEKEVWNADIYVRVVGKMGSSIKMDTTVWDGVTYVHVGDYSFSQDKGSKFVFRTDKLLIDGYQDLLWTLETNTNFRIMQMRIVLT